MKYRRPRYMNEGGIASLMSNGGSEAMMLGLEGERTAYPGSNSPRGMSMREYWDVFPEEEPWLSKAAEGYVDFFDPNPAAKGVLDFMDSYEDLKDETQALGDSMSEGEAPFNMQETYDEEVGILESGRPFDSLSPELMKSVAEGLVPGGGMVKMGKMGFGVLGRLFDAIKRGNASRKTSKRVKEMDELIRQSEEGMARRAPLHKKHEELMERLRSTKVGRQELGKVRKSMNMDEYSSKGQDPRPPSLGTERSKPPEIPKYIPKKKPPKMWYGGAPLYKKGYYGKSYK